MKIKVSATSPKSAGLRSSLASGSIIIAVLVVHVMFATKLVATQQVAFKMGRAPRVYNALITSDQQLLPSQADPIVMPVFRPFPFFYNGWPEVYAAAAPVAPVSSRLVQQQLPVGVTASSVPDPSSSPEAVGDVPQPPAAVIKNNKPADTSVPDVPPPPLPVSRAGAIGEKKKPEEFPPAPVGFAI